MRFVIKPKILIWSVIAILLILGLALGVLLSYKKDAKHLGIGSVVANGIECAEIGRQILEIGGGAVDAAIATLFCETVTCPQSMGLGGGFVGTVYIRKNQSAQAITAREMAPASAHEKMFVNKTVTGGLAVAVPGELKGYWSMYKKYGTLPWRKLIEPTIQLSRSGVEVSKYLRSSLEKYEDVIMDERNNLKEIFVNPKTNKIWNRGDKMKWLKYAETLEIIAEEGEKAIYGGGKIGKLLVEDINKFGGNMTEQDLKDYRVRWEDAVSTNIHQDYQLYTTPLPSSGNILTFILNLMNNLLTKDELLLWHRLVESFKHGYGLRTLLGDKEYVPNASKVVEDKLSNSSFIDEIRRNIFDNKTFNNYTWYGANFFNEEDHGTANIAVLSPNGDAVVITSTINTIFGAKIRSKNTGIILNDEMDDFSTPGLDNIFGIPPSPSNFIKPGKMPMSSMCPTVITNLNGDVRLLIGAAGGSKITTSVASIIIHHLFLNEPLDNCVQAPRLHHQLAPPYIEYEDVFPHNVIEYLNKTIGHDIKQISPGSGFAAVTAISIIENVVAPSVDHRRKGSLAIYLEKGE